MNVIAMVLGILSLLGQDPTVPAAPQPPEVVRVLSIAVRQVDGSARYVAPSLAPIQDMLEQVPGNHFTEIGFHEIKVPYGQEGSADLGDGGYTFWFRPSEYTEAGEVVFECHIDLKDGAKSVEALRVNGKVARDKGTAFRGLPLRDGELMVVMSIAREDDPSRTSDSGGSGDPSKGAGEGDGDSSGQADGENGADGPENEKEKAEAVPGLESREPVPPRAPIETPGDRGEATKVALPLPKDMSTIEGILRALEEQDIQEQKNARSRRFDVVIRGDWW